jgi:hypothetical protein
MLQRLALRIYFEYLSKYHRMYVFACLCNSLRQKIWYHFTVVIVSKLLSMEKAGLVLRKVSIRISVDNLISWLFVIEFFLSSSRKCPHFFPVALRSNAGYGFLIFWFLDHTQRRNTVCRTPLDEWSARPKDLYMTTHKTRQRQTSMPPRGFEPTILADECPQTLALDCAASGID